MKLKLLLFLFLFAGVLTAQEDTVRTLIITEAHLGSPGRNFVELSNVGGDPIDLSNFEIGESGNNAYSPEPGKFMMLPEQVLEPKESFLIAVVHDFSAQNARALGLEHYTNPEPSQIAQMADLQIHVQDYDFFNNQLGISPEFQKFDSITNTDLLNMYFSRSAVYIEQHFADGDSLVVDQVMGVFDTATDTEGVLANKSITTDQGAYDIAGYPNAGSFATLIRKNIVKQGNTDFIRGTAEDDSEWIAIKNYSGIDNRVQPWTLGNHGDFKLDENTLESDVIDIDFANQKLTVPWGMRRPDDIMLNMKKKPGIAWFYEYSTVSADSMAFACRTGDKLNIVVCGDEGYRATFDIEVTPPTASDNIVIPMMNEGGDYAYYYENLSLGWPKVTRLDHGNDTITGSGSSIVNRGLPEGLRVDTLLERLEKPANATWEIVPVDGNNERPDLLDGDVLKVTSEDGSVKEYYIQESVDVGNDNARLSTITWPDIPDPMFYEAVYGWKGDTIPNFMPNVYNYQLKLPPDVQSVPATVAKPSNLNADVQVKRATYLKGTQEERTTVYTVTATDDTTIQEYKVEWQPEIDPVNIQPYQAEPFISEHIMREYFGNNYLEICNPGNQPLDLSNYMIVNAFTTNPAEAIEFNPENWEQRFRKYVPGYKWVDQATWANKRGYLVPDIAVNPIVQGGDVFCMGEPSTSGWFGFGSTGWSGSDWPGAVGGKYGQSDVNFYLGWGNPWGENVQDDYTPIANGYGSGSTQYLFKITNDSVRQCLKPATDPNDFQLIDIIGNADGSAWLFGWESMDDGHNFTRFYRKPHINKPNPVMGASMGETPEESEWVRVTRFSPEGVGGWPEQWILTAMIDFGKHYFTPSTEYLSTVSSRVYKVSEGYELEDIKGLVTGVTVSAFFDNLTRKNENQNLVVKSTADGSELGQDAMISLNDTLVVTSANGENVTKYVLEVSEEGLSADAKLTSNIYTITVDDDQKSAGETTTGSVSGMQYGTQLTTVLNNITVPDGASLNVIDSEGNFVPMKRLNFDTIYVNVTVNTDTWLEVTAEDGVTTINYQILPVTSSDDAFITSDFFHVIQSDFLVEFVPRGISVNSFMNKVASSAGATVKIIDKSGLERTKGSMAIDDKVVVTSESGNVTNVYFISVLPIEALPSTTYLAYVSSYMYAVDQVDNKISGATAQTMLDDFLNNLIPSFGATLTVLDKDGVEKSSGDLDDGDVLVVTSVDGKFQTEYALNLDLTGADRIQTNQVVLYPNPTDGRINISGLEPGGRVQVFNATGAAIRELNVTNSVETLSLDNQPAGMYLILVSDQEKLVGRYKVIRR